jgi:hypothetical protein
MQHCKVGVHPSFNICDQSASSEKYQLCLHMFVFMFYMFLYVCIYW